MAAGARLGGPASLPEPTPHAGPLTRRVPGCGGAPLRRPAGQVAGHTGSGAGYTGYVPSPCSQGCSRAHAQPWAGKQGLGQVHRVESLSRALQVLPAVCASRYPGLASAGAAGLRTKASAGCAEWRAWRMRGASQGCRARLCLMAFVSSESRLQGTNVCIAAQGDVCTGRQGAQARRVGWWRLLAGSHGCRGPMCASPHRETCAQVDRAHRHAG